MMARRDHRMVTVGVRLYLSLTLACGLGASVVLGDAAIQTWADLVPTNTVRVGLQAEPDSGCSRRHVVHLITRFFNLYNKGRTGRLQSRIFEPEPRFRWYSDHGLGRHITIRNRSKLARYFDRRHSRADHLRLIRLRVRKERSQDGGFGFTFRLYRTANDLPPRHWHGKGAADCGIYVWSFGAEG
jgi:hypothetical protein